MGMGMIIQFYRKKAGITQESLGVGICSATHVSKIERGLTEFSDEITGMLAEKLGINMERELYYLSNIKERLDAWLEAIIDRQMQTAADIRRDLEKNPLLEVSEHETLYQLLSLMFMLKQDMSWDVEKYVRKLPEETGHLSYYNQNVYKHVLGMYHWKIGEQETAIQYFKTIDFHHYSNGLVYYDLAVAYYYNNSPVLAYHYGDKALQLFKQKNNFLGIIDAENVMIIQIESGTLRDFKETEEQFRNLLRICDMTNSKHNKGKLLHNFAYEHFRRQQYHKAAKLYKESMDLKEKESAIYLLSLEGYIRSCYRGAIATKEALLYDIHEGLKISKSLNLSLYTIILTVHKYAVLDRTVQYYKYLHQKALPFFKKNGYVVIAERFEKELFTYYYERNQKDAALEIASNMMQTKTHN